MFILNISYTQAPAKVEPHIPAHGAWVKQYLDAGIFLFAGPKKSGLGGIIACASISKEKLKEILNQDSYVQADVAEYQMIDFDSKLTQAALDSLKQA